MMTVAEFLQRFPNADVIPRDIAEDEIIRLREIIAEDETEIERLTAGWNQADRDRLRAEAEIAKVRADRDRLIECVVDWCDTLDKAGEEWHFDIKDDAAATYFHTVSINAGLARSVCERLRADGELRPRRRGRR